MSTNVIPLASYGISALNFKDGILLKGAIKIVEYIILPDRNIANGLSYFVYFETKRGIIQ